MKKFAVLQLSGCAGCEVALLNAEAWVAQYKLVYMPLVVSAEEWAQTGRISFTTPGAGAATVASAAAVAVRAPGGAA